MLPTLRSRRRPRYGTHLCAAVSALLLLFSVVVLHSRLGADRQPRTNTALPSIDLSLDADGDPLLEDAFSVSGSGFRSFSSSDDRIDELDIVDEDPSRVSASEEEILRGVESENEDDHNVRSRVSGFLFDHVVGVIRRPFDRRSIDNWEDYDAFDATSAAATAELDRSKGAFASDDVAVDSEARKKAAEVSGVEDALLLKTGSRSNPLRDGWGVWFDKKSDFLRRDRMFRSNLDLLNPLNNPMLQDPDGIGTTGLTRGDRLVQKLLMNEFKSVPFGVKIKKKQQEGAKQSNSGDDSDLNSVDKSDIKWAERRTLDDNASFTDRTSVDFDSTHSNENLSNAVNGTRVAVAQGITLGSSSSSISTEKKLVDLSIDETKNLRGLRTAASNVGSNPQLSGHIYADGKRWGYFPGLHPHLSFSDFMEAFFTKGECHLRVFMVWNSPSWMYVVRLQRGLESLLFHHKDACVVVFSETIELNFFKDYVKDGFKVAVAMPNLDELLKDTPVHIFSSVWFEWRKTKFYATHYSELVRLAVLYRYGGIYLDCDIIVLKPLDSLENSIGLEDQIAGGYLNGAVMAFRKHSPFIMECLTEFHATYDDTKLRWNGADLLTRVGRFYLNKEGISNRHIELNMQPSSIFFPIDRNNITRYFLSPATENERAQQDFLFKRILNESFTFHLWNSLTFAVVPDPESIVARLIDHTCIHCFDLL